MKRYLAIVVALCLGACSTAPQGYVSPDAVAEARLRDLRNAEARLHLIRTRIDLSKETDDAALREYDAAHDHLVKLRSEYGPTETGYDDSGYHPLGALGVSLWGPGTLSRPTGINGRQVAESD